MPVRRLTDHAINPANDALLVRAIDEPSHGGAHHKYALEWKAPEAGPGFRDGQTQEWHDACILNFQKGPIAEAGVNGITHEALLAVLIDRLRCFQAGPYACRENAIALTHLEDALHWLMHRTRARTARGVEGTHKV